MLISKVVEGDEGLGEGGVIELEDHSQEYRTANELFQLMAKDQNFDTGDADSLPTQDLVLLYKNIDLGTRLMSNANQIKIRKPNQHVETVIHNDENDSDESVINDIYSNEDLHSIFMINNERIDLLNSPTWTSHNTLCQKNGDLEMKSSSMKSEYEKHFLFHDPYIKEQLQNLRSLSSNTNDLVNSVNTLVPPSLLDYICCKRLEDNYNFYMDNIIRYVQNTIDQLKRISNGDYLTDKAKEKWREFGPNDAIHGGNTKVLATSTSIPLHVERKSGAKKSTWDDIVHSEVDVRSLSKILEKRIILEIPKLVCSSFTFLTKRCADNLIISCKKENNTDESNESRVNVVFQLHRSETGQVMSNINSLMIVQSKAAVQFTNDTLIEEIREIPLPLPYKKICNDEENIETKECLSNTNNIHAIVPAFSNVLYNINDANVENRKVDDVSYTQNANGTNLTEKQPFGENSIMLKDSQNANDQNEDEYLDCDTYDDESEYTITTGYQESSFSSNMDQIIAEDKETNENVTDNNIIPPDDLLVSIQQFTSQKPLPEENEDLLQALPKKKSPTRVRIKSPYENKSYYIEEKKRKKLLEIRERRERNKKALAEKCRVSKHKYGKASVIPQSSNSVTKLSITNKSFYDSIYGQNNNVLKESKQIKVKNETSSVKREVLEVLLPCVGDDPDIQNSVATNKETKYDNRNYYSDNTETEVMFISMERKEKDDKEFSIDSVAPNDIHMKLIKQRVAILDNVLNKNSENKENVDLIPFNNKSCEILENMSKAVTSRNIHNIVPSNTPDEKDPSEVGKHNSKKAAAPVECRKSIDKIYDLLNKLGKSQEVECKLKSKFTANYPDNLNVDANVSQGSDSGTSLKHHASSSNASYFSIEKGDHPENLKQSEEQAKAHLKVKIPKEPMTSNQKFKEKDKTKERKRTIGSPIVKIRDNPLKAISQLLHNFENVQKNHHRNIVDQKLTKKPDTSADARGHVRKNPKYQSRVDGQNEAQYRLKATSMPKEKLKKSVMDAPKIPFQQTPVNDKHDKGEKNKICDILDEVKEARGEAVRGPSKFSSRLNSLAQPKRVYVQAHSEEYQSKYGRNLMADRLQRLAAATPTERNIGSAHSRTKSKKNLEPTSMVSVKQATPGQQLGRPRSSGTQVREILNQPGTKTCSSVKQNVPESPETLMKKMVKVESYVKHHYGRASSTARGMEETKRLSSTSLLSDIELASISSSPSLEVPTEIGRQLNDVVSNIIMVNHHIKNLEVLPQSINESRTDLSNYRIHGNRSLLKNLYEDCHRKDCAEASIENQFDDKNSYVVVPRTEKKKESAKNEDKHIINIEMKPHKSDMQPFKALKDMDKVQHALHRRLSVGTFQKRLRIKNITLTPNHSMQQMFVLQSGDTTSLVLKTTLSSSLREKKINNFTDLNNLPALSATHFNWSSAQIPMQIATVGYVIPEYNSSQYTPSIMQLYKVAQAFGSKSILAKPAQDKDIQCCEGDQSCLKEKDSKETNCSSIDLINSNQKQYSRVVSEREPVVNGHQYSIEPDYDLQTNAANETKDINTSTGQTDIDVTKSLDVLVGLLNEIQKITTCQTKLTKPDTDFNGDLKEIETIFKNAETMEHSNKSKLISTTSLDKLQQLKSSQSQSSIYELYLSDNHKFERSSRMNLNLELQDINGTGCKDAYVDLKNQCDDRFTEVPSILFPVSISYGTNVSESMLVCGSMHSVISCSDFRSVCSDHSENLEYVNNLQHPIISEQKLKTKNRISGWLDKLNSDKAECKSINSNMGFKNSYNRSKKEIALLKNTNISRRNCCLNDPNMNVKRDILVTFYSILVFTVFAAFSFPEFMYSV